ncbi:MAG: DUF2924 domain-containing protein [Elusimicrobiaceae bacterium]|nr:DUF2924 domain-containing protein [Elusimicrobiaceae bacterium]
MKKNTKKSVAKTKPTQPAVLRVASPITQAESMVENLPVRVRDNRLPAPGSILTKTYRGKTIEVKVLENGFEYEGKVFKSISRVAMTIVKRQISGYVFFGLAK